MRSVYHHETSKRWEEKDHEERLLAIPSCQFGSDVIQGQCQAVHRHIPARRYSNWRLVVDTWTHQSVVFKPHANRGLDRCLVCLRCRGWRCDSNIQLCVQRCHQVWRSRVWSQNRMILCKNLARNGHCEFIINRLRTWIQCGSEVFNRRGSPPLEFVKGLHTKWRK